MAFADCHNLASVTIPEGVTSIGDEAFRDCSRLTGVTIPEGVTSIGGYAFYGCRSLTSVTIPEGVTSIEDGVFSDCRSLTSVTIPAGVTSIGNRAFSYCRSLTGVTIPESVTSIGEEAFVGCENLSSMIIQGKNTRFGKTPFGNVLPKGLIGQIGGLYAPMTDGSLKQYVLTGDVWNRLDPALRAEIFQARQGKTLLPAYGSCVSSEQAGSIGESILTALSGKASARDCNTAASFMTLFSVKASPELLQKLYAALKGQKNAAKALKAVEEDPVLMDKLVQNPSAEDDLPEPERRVKEQLVAQKRSLKQLESELKSYYSLVFSDLPELKNRDGAACEAYVTAWLLMAHERLETSRYGQPDVVAVYGKHGLRPEAAEVAALLDPASLQTALRKLADEYLVPYQNTKKKYLAFPICRYADEATMAELTKRAPKWSTSVSGNNAPPLREFRAAAMYSNTRAAMLFAERYHELD